MSLAIVLSGLISAVFIVHAQTSIKVNSTVRLERDKSNGLFTLTINDPEGIKEFSLKPPKKAPYGGGLGCPTTFKSDNIIFAIDDFDPKMDAVIADCKENVANLELPPLKDGKTKGVVAKSEGAGSESAPAPTSVGATPQAPSGSSAAPKPKPSLLTNIKFPVKELGNCQSEVECLAYCDSLSHGKACLEFAKKNKLKTEEETKHLEKVMNVKEGPGGCTSQKSCDSYCSDISNINECVEFAEKNGYLEGGDLEEAQKIRDALKRGVKMPGNCKTKSACESYCNSADNADECLAFADESGFMDPLELEHFRKFTELNKKGETPGGCSSRESCEFYCQSPDNMEECIAFGEKAGFLSGEELEMAKKFLPLMKAGKSPGGCRSKEQCEAYCEDDAHFDECVKFGVENGMVSQEDAEIIKKTGGKGPGGCRGKEKCESYCQEHQEECFVWAQENGMISEGELSKMKEGLNQFSKQVENFPPEVVDCLKNAIGEENFSRMQSGHPVFDRDLEKKMQACFEIMSRELGIEFGDGGSFKGPGGCSSQQECMDYCKANQDDEGCKRMMQGFGMPSGGGDMRGFPGGVSGPGGGFSGPGGCKTKEECVAYCQSHPNDCQGFMPSGLGGGGGSLSTGSGQGLSTGSGQGGGGGGSSGFSGPGGCNSIESCVSYCTSHTTDPDCAKYIGGGGGGPGGCKTQDECLIYCQVHQDDAGCRSYCLSHPGVCGDDTGGPLPTQSCIPPPSGLVGWWNGDSLSGTAKGGVTIVSGKVGNAFKFGGSGSINMGNQANLNFGKGPFSLEVWFNWDGGGSSKGNIIRKSNYPASGNGAGYWLVVGKDNKILEFFTGETVGNEGQPRGRISVSVSTGEWHHVVAARNDSGTMNLFLDGELKGSVQALGADTTSEAPFTLGAWDDRFGTTEFFSGFIDEVSVYGRALSVSEVSAVFNAGNMGKCAGSSSMPPPSPPADYPTTGQYPSSGGQITQEYCSYFVSVPACSYVGSPDSQNYKYCKECFPDK